MKTKMPLGEAEKIACKYADMLMPYCERIEIAGSIRRRKAEVVEARGADGAGR